MCLTHKGIIISAAEIARFLLKIYCPFLFVKKFKFDLGGSVLG